MNLETIKRAKNGDLDATRTNYIGKYEFII